MPHTPTPPLCPGPLPQILDEQIVAFEHNIRIMKASLPAHNACLSHASTGWPGCWLGCGELLRAVRALQTLAVALCALRQLTVSCPARCLAGIQGRPAAATARPAAPATAACAGSCWRPARGCAGSPGVPPSLMRQAALPGLHSKRSDMPACYLVAGSYSAACTQLDPRGMPRLRMYTIRC